MASNKIKWENVQRRISIRWPNFVLKCIFQNNVITFLMWHVQNKTFEHKLNAYGEKQTQFNWINKNKTHTNRHITEKQNLHNLSVKHQPFSMSSGGPPTDWLIRGSVTVK